MIYLATALAHFNPLGVYKDEKSAGVTTFRFVVSTEKERNINKKQKVIFIQSAEVSPVWRYCKGSS